MNSKSKARALNNAFFRVAFVTLILLVLASLATILVAGVSKTLPNNDFPGLFATLFFSKNYLGTEHNAYATGQILNNLVAYFFMLSALVVFVLSFVLIKHSPSIKFKSAFIALFLIVPATIGLTGGFIDFIGHGLALLTKTGGARDSLLAFGLIITYVLDFIYYICAIVYLAVSVKTAVKINKGEMSYDEAEGVLAEPEEEKSVEDKLREEEEEAEKRAALLADIRTIVREELNRLDRVVIAKEITTKRAEEPKKEPAPAKEPEPAPAPVEEVEEEEEKESGGPLIKGPAIPRVPFAEKIVKAEKETQEKYNELKNEILAYGASSRLSIAGDTFRLHRKAYVKITLVGKTLKVYFALNPNDYAESKIPVADASDKSAYEEVPALLKVRSKLSVKRAKELVAAAFAADGIEKVDEVGNHNFVKDIRAQLRNK